MKKLFLLLSLAGLAAVAQARPLSEAEAHALAAQKVPALAGRGARVQAKGLANTSETPLYLFSAPEGGFAIVAADDSMPNAVLAYSLQASLDIDNCPPALTAWLNGMAALVASGNFSSVSRSQLDYSNPVGPMITTKWNQDAPFNNLTPAAGDVDHCPTGCAATAIAQVINYWEYPTQGGLCEHSYNWKGQTLSVDFRESRYDWANMADVYTSSSTEAQNAAVAKLMYDCGVAINMDYGPEESGTDDVTSTIAMVDIFGYSLEIRRCARMMMTDDEWFELVKTELDAGRPLVYMGTTVNDEGHAFVCDGYDAQGLCHINWGWGGMCDGYFDLNSLDPENQGIGGAASGEGYKCSQSIIAGCRPPMPGDVKADGWHMGVYRFYLVPEDAEGSVFSISPLFINAGYRDFEGQVVVYIAEQGQQAEDSDIIADFTGDSALTPQTVRSAEVEGIEAADLPDGVYELSFAVIPADSPDVELPIRPVNDCEPTCFEIRDGKLVFDPRPVLEFENVSVEAIDYFSVFEGVRCIFATLSAEVTNNSGITYNNGYSVTAEYENGVFMPTSRVTTDFYLSEPIEPGQTVALELPVFFNANSEVAFEISECANPDGSGPQQPLLSGNSFKVISEAVYHELSLAGDPALEVEKGRVTLTMPVQSSFGGNTKELDEEAEIERELTCSIFDNASDSLEPVATATATFQGKWHEPLSLVFEPGAQLPEGEYTARVSYTSAPYGFGLTSELSLGEESGFEGLVFTIDSSSLPVIMGAHPAAADAPCYDLMGRRVENPARGFYIRNGHKVIVK